MNTTTATGTTGAKHVMNSPLTTTATREVSPDLLVNDVDSRIVKIRPMATPVDQISRMGQSRHCKSMTAEYYSVDTIPVNAATTADVQQSDKRDTFPVKVDRPEIFSSTETVLIPDCFVNSTPLAAMFYVVAVDAESVTLQVLSGLPEACSFPEICSGSRVIRMGRAAAELDVQTPSAQAVPKKESNYCQIFKAQVEESHLQSSAAKEVGWTLSDQEEVAILDMRQGMEKSFLFGQGMRWDKGAGFGEVYTTRGIWHQAAAEFHYTKGALDPATLVGLSRVAFTGNGSSSRKVLVAGSGLVEALSSMETVKTVGATQTVTRWGIDFTEIHTRFGRLYVVLSETFDACGHENDGMVIDPEYLQKYVHIPSPSAQLPSTSARADNATPAP